MTTVSPAVPDQGRLEIAERAVVKVARQVASEVTGAGGRSGGLLGVGAKGDLAARPEVEVHLGGSPQTGTTATLRVTVGLPYPAPVRDTTEQIRRHIRQRVPALTGIEVHRVDIEVAWLLPSGLVNDEGSRQTGRQLDQRAGRARPRRRPE